MQVSMNISESTGTTSTGVKLYTGLEEFHVVAVNPNKQELADLGINVDEEPTYTRKVESKFDGKEYDSFTLRVFLDNKNPNNPIRTSVNFSVVNQEWVASTGKVQVINDYGGTTWVEPEVLKDVTKCPYDWYVTDGMKPALKGEETLVAFIRALRNFPNVKSETPVDTRKGLVSVLNEADFTQLFAGDFSDIKKVVMSDPDLTVTFLLGVRKVDEDTYRQTVFPRLPMRPYMAKEGANTDYLVKQVNRAQDNGSFSDSQFNLNDFEVKLFDPNTDAVTPTEDDDLPF